MNRIIKCKKGLRQILLVLFSLAMLAGYSFAQTNVYLVAREYQKALPGTAGTVTMWGFAEDADQDLSTDDGEIPTSPGPVITIPPAETTLNIHLRNELDVPVSIIIPGLPGGDLVPEFISGRVHSMTHETDPSLTVFGLYTWHNASGLKAGTHLYHSGTNQPVQVPMGLYGAVKKDAAPGVAYISEKGKQHVYDNEVILFYSEIDPALNEAVTTPGGYGPGTDMPSTIGYAPKYFLLNGATYPDSVPLAAHPILMGEKVLVRILNAGLKTHVPTLQNSYIEVISEDGNLYPYPFRQYSVRLPAGRTADAVLMMTGSSCGYPVYDRRLYLTDNGASPGGMFTFLNRENPGAVDDSYIFDLPQITHTVPPIGVLMNDCDEDSNLVGALTAELFAPPTGGTVDLRPDGSFDYTPNSDTTSDSFTYVANDGTLDSNVATVSLKVLNHRSETSITSGNDDAEELLDSGKIDLSSSDLEMVEEDSTQVVGMRFIVDIPQGAIITNAYIEFTVDEEDDVETSLLIEGQNADNAPTFNKIDGNISSRTDRTAGMDWLDIPAWTKGTKQMTPDIKSIIQAIVGRTNWTNSIVIFITGTGKRVADSYDGDPAGAPKLHVEYSLVVEDVYNYYCDKDGDGYISSAVSETCTGAGCTVPTEWDCQETPPTPPDADCDDTLVTGPSVYPGAVEMCDGLDNDCDDGTPDGFNDPARPDNINQEGVCAGSKQSCNGVTWEEDYSSVPFYEPAEVTCGDGKDNDCDGATDTDPECTATTTIWVPVATGDDDAEEAADGGVGLSSSDLELVEEDSTQTVGIRFQVDIPKDAIITKAYIQFTADETHSGMTTLTIEGEDTGNAAPFEKVDWNISSRTPRTSSVSWSPDPWKVRGEAGPKQMTTDISPIIQEIVSNPGWAANNWLAIIITGEGKRTAESYNGSAPPVLHVEYSTFVPDLHNYYCDKDGDGFISSAVSETCTGAGCMTPAGCVETPPGDDCDDTLVTGPSVYPGAIEVCDGLDNDCNEGTPDGDDEPAQLNSNQIGVCAGSTKSCIEGVMTDDYSTVPDYEPAEVTCDDMKDNDCDTLVDTDPECTATTTIWVPVATGDDDAEERASGSMKLGSSDLEMVYDKGGNQHVGIRFNGVDIPKGANIINAYIEFTVDEANEGDTYLWIQGHDSYDAPAFTSDYWNISDRDKTSASVSWNPSGWTTARAKKQTPNIAEVIKEIVDRTLWDSGHSIVIIVTGTGERTADSYDGSPSGAPVLHVEYTP
jgi:hypothetical protein